MRADEQKGHRRLVAWGETAQCVEALLFSAGSKWSGCASKVHALIRGDLSRTRLRNAETRAA
jgi:hypothetical protein